ncbi:MAG TPA: DUF3617 family protein [Bryobacteraceae bacterium]|nr:DUF3617 family protein [Bryobacteraceae bacterium]
MRNVIFLATALLMPLASWAADDIKPLGVKLGLWESMVTTQTSGMPPIPEEVLSKLSPDQRARMEEAMKARQAKGAQPRTNKSCLTKESLDKAMTFGNEGNQSCKRTVMTSNSSKQEIRFECSDERTNIKSTGTMHVEALNSENVKGSGQVSSGNGTNSMNIQISFSAKWLGSDCGALK